MNSLTPSVTPPKTSEDIRRLQSERKRHAVAPGKARALLPGQARQHPPRPPRRCRGVEQDTHPRQGHAAQHVGHRSSIETSAFLPADGDGISEYWRSGGTTGRPLFYPRSHGDLIAAMVGFCRVFHCAGMRAPQRVHCSFPLGIHPAGQMMARAAEKSGHGSSAGWRRHDHAIDPAG